MRVLVTGSAGHLGEALSRVLRDGGHDVTGVDLKPSPYTTVVGSVADRDVVRPGMAGVDAVLHAATLHKPHVGSHSKQEFVDANVTGTLTLLEEAAAAGVGAFVFTSSTSAFGRALTPAHGQPAAWITEDVVPRPRNIYGVTKTAAEDLCELVHAEHGLPVVVLRTSRFFPEGDDNDDVRAAYPDANVKANEYLYRRVDVADAVAAHLLAVERAAAIGFGRYVISATTPFTPADLAGLSDDAPAVVRRLFPDYEAEYDRRGWRMFPSIGRVYVNTRARADLAGSRATTSGPSSTPCGPARTRAARSLRPSARRGTTTRPPACTPASRPALVPSRTGSAAVLFRRAGGPAGAGSGTWRAARRRTRRAGGWT